MPSQASAEMRKHLVKQGVRPGVSLADQRKEWADYAAKVPLVEGTRLQEEIIAGVPCVWIRSADNGSEDRRTILYFHGGGLVDGSPVTHREFASRLARTTELAVILVDYRLAPEHPFPAALDDALAVYRALVSRPHSGGMVLGGDSSGATLVLSLMVRLRDAGEKLPEKAFTICGAFDASLSGESLQTRADLDPCLSVEELVDWQKHFKGSMDLKSPLLSPLFAELHGLPPLLMQAGDHDLWLSDTLRVAEKIKRSGGTVGLHVWDSMWHVWPMYSGLPEADEAIAEIGRFITSARG